MKPIALNLPAADEPVVSVIPPVRQPVLIDCRTCTSFSLRGCRRTALCINGDDYQASRPVYLWEPTTC